MIFIGSGLLIMISILYLFVGLGAPYGFLVMGGKHQKALPPKMRIQVLVSIPIQLLAVYTLLFLGGLITDSTSTFIRVIGYFFMIFFTLNIFMNLASKSKYEKWIMTPAALLIAISFVFALFF